MHGSFSNQDIRLCISDCCRVNLGRRQGLYGFGDEGWRVKGDEEVGCRKGGVGAVSLGFFICLSTSEVLSLRMNFVILISTSIDCWQDPRVNCQKLCHMSSRI